MSRSSRVGAALLACMLVSTTAAAAPAGAPPAAASTQPRQLSEISIDAKELERAGEDIDKLRRSLDKRLREALADREVEMGVAGAPRVRLVLRWLDYERSDYAGKFELQRSATDAWVDATRFECFACSSTALSKRVLAELPGALAKLDEPDAAPTDPTPPVATEPAPPIDTPPPPQSRARLGPVGKAGIGLLAVGVVGVAVGIGLVASDGNQPDDELVVTDLRKPGFAALGVGVALAVGGAVMLGVDVGRAKKRRAAAAPMVGRRMVGMGVVVRF